MSKRDLKKYLLELDKSQLEEQILALYDKFPNIRTYYNFVFNPNEDKLLQEAKIKISNEYFPIRSKKAKMKRSTAHNFIKHFITLGVDPFIVADIMLYNIEIAQTFSSEKPIKQELFYKSMLNSFESAISYMIENGILNDFKGRVEAIKEQSVLYNWINQYEFVAIVERFDY